MVYILRGKGMGEESMPAVASLLGIEVFTSDNAPQGHDLVFRWGCISLNLGQTKIVNKSGAIQEVSDKKSFRKKLSDAGLAPVTFTSFEEFLDDDYPHTQGIAEPIEWVVRPDHHQRSQSIYHCTKLSQVYSAWQEIGTKGYISQYIPKTREYRAFVCQNRIAFMIEKTPKDKSEISWGCVSTGDFKYVDWSNWPEHVSENAIKSMKVSNLDFGAVDIIVREYDNPGQPEDTYSLEINTACHLSPYYQKCVAKCFKHIIQNGRDHFPDPENFNWKNVIHPAIMKDL